MKLALDKVTLILPANPMRSRAYITVISDATIYISKFELESALEYESNQGFPIKLYGVHEVKGYKGDIYATSDTSDADVRVIEYSEGIL